MKKSFFAPRAVLILCLSSWLSNGSCSPVESSTNQQPHQDGDHQAVDDHEHEKPHGEIPRSIRLSDRVIEEAKIVTVPVRAVKIAPTVRLSGEVHADLDRRARVAARVEGIIEEVFVRPGDSVTAGTVLATIRAPNLQHLRSDAASLRARASSARANADRIRTLVERRMASDQEALAAESEAQALESEAQAARGRMRALGVKSSQKSSRNGAVSFSLRSPKSGIVVERDLVSGDPVNPDTVVATVVSIEEVWFVAHVFERDISRVYAGSAAEVRLNAYPHESFRGEVEYVSHQVDPGARTLSARIPLSNVEGKLRLGLFGVAHVVVGQGQSNPVPAVPNSAVSRMLGKNVVFVRHADGDFEAHDVVLGESDTDFSEIVHGLRVGEQIVSEGAFTIKSALLRSTLGEHGH